MNVSSGKNPSHQNLILFQSERIHYIISDLGVIMRKENAIATHGGYTVIETI